MPKLSAEGLRWIKGFHLITVSCWIGGAVALILLYWRCSMRGADDYGLYFNF